MDWECGSAAAAFTPDLTTRYRLDPVRRAG